MVNCQQKSSLLAAGRWSLPTATLTAKVVGSQALYIMLKKNSWMACCSKNTSRCYL